jgi:hypothetical protein
MMAAEEPKLEIHRVADQQEADRQTGGVMLKHNLQDCLLNRSPHNVARGPLLDLDNAIHGAHHGYREIVRRKDSGGRPNPLPRGRNEDLELEIRSVVDQLPPGSAQPQDNRSDGERGRP